jgi:predicted ArsR family transcriptional regulator
MPLTARKKEILRIISRRQPISNSELTKLLGCTPRTTGQHLWVLKTAGLVQASGVGCRTTWTLVPQSAAELPVRDVVGAPVRSVFEWRP